MTTEHFIDARYMEPPEPLARSLNLVNNLQQGDYLRFRHRREPFPLYDNLTQRNFMFITCTSKNSTFEIFIWNKDDADAESAVQSQIQLSNLAIHYSNLNTANS